jgi:hypothetical protein
MIMKTKLKLILGLLTTCTIAIAATLQPGEKAITDAKVTTYSMVNTNWVPIRQAESGADGKTKIVEIGKVTTNTFLHVVWPGNDRTFVLTSDEGPYQRRLVNPR